MNEFPECLNFDDELRTIDEAACISFDDIKETIEQIKSSSNNLQKELNESNVSERFEDKFVEVMSPFALECQRQIEVLVEMMNRWQNIYIKVGEYFAFDVNKSSMQEFFLNIKKFKESFAKAHTEVVKTPESKHNAQPVGRKQQKPISRDARTYFNKNKYD